MSTLIADAGPLAALFKADDQWHPWALQTGRELTGTLHTCEAVLTEAFFLLARVPGGQKKLQAALRKPGLIVVSWRFDEHRPATLDLMEKYADIPASLADACLVRMAEDARDPVIWTTDEHFSIYRLRGNRRMRVISPSTRP